VIIKQRTQIIYLLVGVVLVGLVLTACSSSKQDGCTLPPEDFTETDLVGTWQAYGGGEDTDTLIIREDGYY
jgi:hypothetical protein